MKELNTKMKKEWRNVKKRGMEQSNRGRKQRPKRGNVGDVHGKERLRMLYKTLPFTATLLKIKICPICSIVYPGDGVFWIACDGCNDCFDLKCTDVEDEEHVPDTYYFCRFYIFPFCFSVMRVTVCM